MHPFGLLIDLLIIILVVLAVIRGWEIGSIRQILSTGGFFLGLYLGSLLQGDLINFAHSTTAKTVVTIVTTLGMALIFLIGGEIIGIYLKKKLDIHKINHLDNFLGSIVSFITVLFSVWLASAIITNLSVNSVRTYTFESYIIKGLNSVLPSAPQLISDLKSTIDPNGFPEVFVGNEPAPDSNIKVPNGSALISAVKQDQPSVVKIEGQGCGGIVEGSGFVASKDLVITNAHVVAGIASPYIQDDNGDHNAKIIWFDPSLDLAILRTNNLNGKPLNIDTNLYASGTLAAILGYPGGASFTAKSAAIINEFSAIGRNIYGKGSSNRSVYALRGSVIPGNSGGPLIEKDGRVIGVIFAESTSYDQVGYALTANQITGPLHQAEKRLISVNNGSCAN